MQPRRNLRRNGPLSALPALLAVLGLLLQGLIPASAMAQEAWSQGKVRTVVICTSAGEQTIAVPADSVPHDQGFAGFKCHACVMASLVAVTPPVPDIAPAQYCEIIRAEHARSTAQPIFARPAPRPPSQGPPTAFNI
jgi:hypothetical protein